MKRRSAGIDEVFNELLFVLDCDGGLIARITRRIFTLVYRTLTGAMIAALRLPWADRTKTRYPESCSEPFNLTDSELEREGLR